MDDGLQAKLALLEDDIQAAVIPSDCKATVAWCFGKLPPLYGKFCQTNESRYGDEITRFVQAMLRELTKGDKVSRAARELAVTITERLRSLHQKLGIAGLGLKTPEPAPTPTRSSRKAVRLAK